MTAWRTELRHTARLTTGLGIMLLLPSCGFFSPGEAQIEPPQAANQPVAVETARAQVGAVTEALEYSGTTRPWQQITLRAQTAGEITAINVDVGDPVQPGDLVAQIDGDLLTARVNEARAELSVRQSEVAENQVSITDAQAAVIQAQASREQAKLDANRLRQLADQGALSQQAAEAAELALVRAEQTVASAVAQVEARESAIAAATGRVDAQQAVVAEAQEQLGWVKLTAPKSATVLTRLIDPGDYVETGTALLELGDLSTLKVVVQVSELDLSKLSIGKPAQIRLDAFADLEIPGRITRIAPVADATSRLVAVEVTMNNPNSRIGSGLLARVRFTSENNQQVVVPTSALENGRKENIIFVIDQGNKQTTVTARSVIVGQQYQGKVEVLSGLEPNEAFVVSSDKLLESRQEVRLSILSEMGEE
ncbi:MAG: efflux RND transporter periplasmic adaptor subunit [Symploca sp. SIO2G7]|nr:efflux RND transporter periplasmic adaptor subunit [Symploca sp. SIO2G7]